MAVDADKAQRFLEMISRMITPYDNMESRKAEYAEDHNLPLDQVTDDDLIDNYSGDDAFSDAQALWDLIDEARALIE